MCHPGASDDRSQVVTVSIPLNTNIVGGLVTRRELRVPSDLVFTDFFSRMCANMDLDPNEALIGYKFPTDRVKDVPRELGNVSEYSAMMQEMRRRILSARTRNPVLFLHNLVSACLLSSYLLGLTAFYSALQSIPHRPNESEKMMQPKIKDRVLAHQPPSTSRANIESWIRGSVANSMVVADVGLTQLLLSTTKSIYINSPFGRG